MREPAGFLLANGMYVVVGLALLWATGLIEARLADAAAAVGLAFLCGIAGVALALILLLVIGVPVTLPVAVAMAVAEIAMAGLVGVTLRRRGRLTAPPPVNPWPRSGVQLAWAIGALVALYFVTEAIAMRRMPVSFDAAHIWTFKATALTYASHLQLELFDNPVTAAPNFSGQDYPILQPVFLSVLFRAMGGPQPENVPLELWLVMAAFVAATLFLLAPRRGPLVAAPAVAAVLGAYGSVLLANADGTLAVFAALGAVCCARWVDEGARRYAVVAGLLLAAAASTKAEGLAFATAILLATLVAAAYRRRTAWLAGWGLAATVTAVALAPWRIWLLVHDPPPNQPAAPIRDALNPSWLGDHSEGLRLGARRVVEQLANQGRAQWAVAGFLAASLLAIGIVPRRRIAALYLGAFALSVLVLVAVYWTSLAPDLGLYVNTSVDRVVLTPILIAAVALAHLLPADHADGLTTSLDSR